MFSLINAYIAMMVIVAASNYLVQFPINDWLTYGAFTYPISFLVTELTNRTYGPKLARKVVYVGFTLACVLSFFIAPYRIAIASVTAFFVSQLLDIFVFNRLRQGPWWYAPFFSSFVASGIDTVIFWVVAFLGDDVPLWTWAAGDFAVKVLLDVLLLTPFRLALIFIQVFDAKRNILTYNASSLPTHSGWQ